MSTCLEWLHLLLVFSHPTACGIDCAVYSELFSNLLRGTTLAIGHFMRRLLKKYWMRRLL